jgi:uncharacterized protein (TIGR02266 family)
MSVGTIARDPLDWTPQQPVRHGRVDMQIPVDLISGDGTCPGITWNVSSDGAFVGTSAALRVGQFVTLRLAIPGSRVPIGVKAEVRWTRGAGEAAGRPAGAGVEFVDPSIWASASISALLQAVTSWPSAPR